VNSSTKIRN